MGSSSAVWVRTNGRGSWPARVREVDREAHQASGYRSRLARGAGIRWRCSHPLLAAHAIEPLTPGHGPGLVLFWIGWYTNNDAGSGTWCGVDDHRAAEQFHSVANQLKSEVTPRIYTRLNEPFPVIADDKAK